LWGEASLSLRFESPAAERRIAAGVDELLDGGATFAREFESIAARVGGPLAVYAHEPRRAAEQRAQIPAEVMVLVKQYDGRKPLIDIVEDSPFKPFDTIKITYRLAQLGAIVRKETRVTTPLTERLAVRDWLLGEGEGAERPRPPTGAAAGVTEAGRRAAEAYAAEAARRAEEKSPADDILDDSASVRAAAAKGAKPAPPAKPAAPAKATAPAKAAAPAKTGPTSKSKKKKESVKAAKLSPQAAAAAPPKEPMTFDAVDEEFFAREADLWHPPAVDRFEDLEPAAPRPSKRPPPRRDWFGLNKKK
jgi:hypothetical protein